MPSFTKNAIKATFIKMLEERPLSTITVKELVEECGINRNSFYYHYQDLPSLIEEIIKEDADAIIEKYPSVNSVVECYDALVEFASKNKKALLHIFRSMNREVFERYLMETSKYFIQSYFTTITEEIMSESDREILINYYKCICFGLIIDWLSSGMDDNYPVAVRKMFDLTKNYPTEIAEMLKNQN